MKYATVIILALMVLAAAVLAAPAVDLDEDQGGWDWERPERTFGVQPQTNRCDLWCKAIIWNGWRGGTCVRAPGARGALCPFDQKCECK